jgi:hypothetical protein
MDRWDGVIAKCVERAAQDLHYQPGERPEAVLVRAVRRALAQDARVQLVDGEPRYALRGWTRPPGGVDVAAELADGTGRLAIETKVGKPEESIWDAIKLADVQVFEPRVRAGCLVSDAYWSAGAAGSILFERASPRRFACRELVSMFPSAWAWAMIGGYGIRPCRSVGGVKVAWVAEAPLAHHPDRRLVAVRVLPDRKAPEEVYDPEGFPRGYEPPHGLRAKVRRADEERERLPAAALAAADSIDPCHGYPWYRKWSQQRIVAVLRSLGDDRDARECLRRRLAAERNWHEQELRARFDPF